jgi:hypothetical protein
MLEILEDNFHARTVREVFGYEQDWTLPAAEVQAAIRWIMADPARRAAALRPGADEPPPGIAAAG